MLVDSVSFPTQPGAVTVLVRTRGRCFKQADTVHNVKQKWGGSAFAHAWKPTGKCLVQALGRVKAPSQPISLFVFEKN